jgi:hypothetical protein
MSSPETPETSDHPPELPAHLRARILDALRSEPVPPRAEGARRSALALALGFVTMTAILLAISVPNLRGRPLAYVEVLVLVWTPVTIAATWAGVARGGSMLGRSPRWLLATAILTPLVLLLSWIPVTIDWPETLVDSSETVHHLRCIAVTLGLSLGPFVAFAWVRRGSDPISPWLTGAAIGTAAAAWGALMLPLICGFTSPVHMLIGHFLPIVLIAAIGAALGGRLVAVRARTE